jgi:hypothetical protein
MVALELHLSHSSGSLEGRGGNKRPPEVEVGSLLTQSRTRGCDMLSLGDSVELYHNN